MKQSLYPMEHLKVSVRGVPVAPLCLYLVFADLGKPHLLKIGHHIGRKIVFRVVDLIADLLRASRLGDHTAGLRHLGDEEGSVLRRLHNGEPQVSQAGHILFARLGEITADDLAAALQQVGRSWFPCPAGPSLPETSRIHESAGAMNRAGSATRPVTTTSAPCYNAFRIPSTPM